MRPVDLREYILPCLDDSNLKGLTICRRGCDWVEFAEQCSKFADKTRMKKEIHKKKQKVLGWADS
jgi:hypothetical protein